jgi:23S rRNA U2552 (ribose-2'-O)-methylase RlmE/FtsJ
MKIYRIGIHDKILDFTEDTTNNVIFENKDELLKVKCKIDTVDSNKWDNSKKNNNEYEYIYTSSRKNQNICSISPVSRSYFKLHEMIIDMHLLKDNINCACLAEGPGGFIHCLLDYSKRINIMIKNIYGITLISNDRKIPYWNQSIINNPINKILFGKDGKGDLYNYETVDTFIETIGENKCHLVTGDGGFDYSEDYNSQEQSSYKLLYSEVFTALNIQAEGGHFVLKMFDLFHYKTIQLLYLLYCHYSIIEIYKPSTSRLSNSEKYIICSNFLGIKEDVKKKLIDQFNTCENLKIDIPQSFIDDINKYNETFISKQIKIITKVLSFKTIENRPTKEQILTAKKWCELYKLPLNPKCIYLK